MIDQTQYQTFKRKANLYRRKTGAEFRKRRTSTIKMKGKKKRKKSKKE